MQRSGHLKSFARFCDATEAATCALPEEARRKESIVNPDVQQLAEELKTRQIRTQAAGIDMIMAYEFESLDGSDLPAWEAGAHLDIVVAPQFPRQYSMCGDPADRRPWRIGVLRELEGRGGSALLHRIFNPGRTLFVSTPINHFLVVATAQRSKLMASGFGIPPIMAMAHELHRARRDFELHCSDRNRSDMAI